MASLQPPKLKFFASGSSGNKETGIVDSSTVSHGPLMPGGTPSETNKIGAKSKRNHQSHQMKKEEKKAKFKKSEKMTKAFWHRTNQLQRETSWIKDVKKLNKLKKMKNKNKHVKTKELVNHENNKHFMENQMKENIESLDTSGSTLKANLKPPSSLVMEDLENIPNNDVDSSTDTPVELENMDTATPPTISVADWQASTENTEPSINTVFPMSMPNLTNGYLSLSTSNFNKIIMPIRSNSGTILKRVKRPLPYSKSQSKYKVHLQKASIGSLDKPINVNMYKKKTETPKFRSFVKATPKEGFWGVKEQAEHQSVSSPIKNPFADVPHGHGFKNFGNSCYMNAVLQALSGLNDFCASIQTAQETQGAMVQTMQHLFNVHQECKDPEDALFSFRQHFVTKVFPLFNNRNQQCASEFLNIVLNEGRREYDVFQKYFQFNYYEETKCKKCEKVTYSRVQEDLMLNLAIPESTNPRSNNIQSLFENQQGTCQECNSDAVTCTFKFSSLPRVLILVLKRYCHEGSLSSPRKVTTPFAPSQTLTVTKIDNQLTQLHSSFQDLEGGGKAEVPKADFDQNTPVQAGASKCLQEEPHGYKLASIVYHHGIGTNIGHYVADVNRGNTTGWLNYDDEVVTQTSLEILEKEENSYIFFYCLEK